jgi:hypothetical protein
MTCYGTFHNYFIQLANIITILHFSRNFQRQELAVFLAQHAYLGWVRSHDRFAAEIFAQLGKMGNNEQFAHFGHKNTERFKGVNVVCD